MCCYGGLEWMRVRSEASKRQQEQDPERAQDLQASQGGLAGITVQSVRDLPPISVLPLLHKLPFHRLPLHTFYWCFIHCHFHKGI